MFKRLLSRQASWCSKEIRIPKTVSPVHLISVVEHIATGIDFDFDPERCTLKISGSINVVQKVVDTIKGELSEAEETALRLFLVDNADFWRFSPVSMKEQFPSIPYVLKETDDSAEHLNASTEKLQAFGSLRDLDVACEKLCSRGGFYSEQQTLIRNKAGTITIDFGKQLFFPSPAFEYLEQKLSVKQLASVKLDSSLRSLFYTHLHHEQFELLESAFEAPDEPVLVKFVARIFDSVEQKFFDAIFGVLDGSVDLLEVRLSFPKTDSFALIAKHESLIDVCVSLTKADATLFKNVHFGGSYEELSRANLEAFLASELGEFVQTAWTVLQEAYSADEHLNILTMPQGDSFTLDDFYRLEERSVKLTIPTSNVPIRAFFWNKKQYETRQVQLVLDVHSSDKRPSDALFVLCEYLKAIE